MSDYRALAAVTATLQQFLHRPAVRAVPGAVVRTGPPIRDPASASSGLVSVFLYHVNPNPTLRNVDLPNRAPNGAILARPQVALDLHYLLSFQGDETRLVPQLLLGAAVSAMNAFPTLDKADIPVNIEGGADLAASGLAHYASMIHFVQEPLSNEELSNLWTMFVQVPYALSIAYRCSTVIIESDLIPQPPLPVLDPRLVIRPSLEPHLDTVEPGSVDTIVSTDTGEARADFTVRGRGLKGGERILIGHTTSGVRASGTDAFDVEVPSELPVGIHAVRVLVEDGSVAVSSNMASVVLLPAIASMEVLASTESVPDGPVLRVVMARPVTPSQRVSVLLNPRPPGEPEHDAKTAKAPSQDPLGPEVNEEERDRRAYRINCANVAATPLVVEFSLEGVLAGTYLARLSVDGMESRLVRFDDDASCGWVGPEVVIS